METSVNISVVIGSVLSLLFSIIAFFLRALYTEFRKVELNLAEIKTCTEVIKANMQAESIRTSERLDLHDKRIAKLERVVLGE